MLLSVRVADIEAALIFFSFFSGEHSFLNTHAPSCDIFPVNSVWSRIHSFFSIVVKQQCAIIIIFFSFVFSITGAADVKVRCDGRTAARHVFISLACDYIPPPAFDYC